MIFRAEKSNAMRALAALMLCICVMAPAFAHAADAPAAPEKDETVNVHTASDGSVVSVDVTTLLRNPNAADELADSSTLENIEGKNAKTFFGEGDTIIWRANGEDVTYTGSTSQAVPVSLGVSYTLDGQPIAPSELAGKSGKVTIRYDFTNHSAMTATVNGSVQTIFTPFTCITALLLDSADFKNVSVENGRVVNDGNDIIVAGYAMPGLKASLGSMAENAEIPEHFTVTADVVNFELKTSMTIVTAGLMSDFNVEALGVESVDDASALTDAMGQLISGSEQLTSGLGALSEGLKQVESGAAGLHEGAESLSGGLYALAGEGGLGTLASGANSIASAIGQVGDAASTMKGELQSASAVLEQAASAAEAYEAALATMQAHKDEMLAQTSLSDAEYSAVEGALLAAQESSNAVLSIAESMKASFDKLDQLKSSVAQIQDSAATLAGGIHDASDSAIELAYWASELESYAEQLSFAMPALVQGAQSATDGSKTLTQGMRTFNDEGVAQLVNTLQDRYGGMLDRMNALSDAAKSYANFAGIAQGSRGSVKFVFETEAITRD